MSDAERMDGRPVLGGQVTSPATCLPQLCGATPAEVSFPSRPLTLSSSYQGDSMSARPQSAADADASPPLMEVSIILRKADMPGPSS